MACPWHPPPNLGAQKNAYGRLLAAKTLHKMKANLWMVQYINGGGDFNFGGKLISRLKEGAWSLAVKIKAPKSVAEGSGFWEGPDALIRPEVPEETDPFTG